MHIPAERNAGGLVAGDKVAPGGLADGVVVPFDVDAAVGQRFGELGVAEGGVTGGVSSDFVFDDEVVVGVDVDAGQPVVGNVVADDRIAGGSGNDNAKRIVAQGMAGGVGADEAAGDGVIGAGNVHAVAAIGNDGGLLQGAQRAVETDGDVGEQAELQVVDDVVRSREVQGDVEADRRQGSGRPVENDGRAAVDAQAALRAAVDGDVTADARQGREQFDHCVVE